MKKNENKVPFKSRLYPGENAVGRIWFNLGNPWIVWEFVIDGLLMKNCFRTRIFSKIREGNPNRSQWEWGLKGFGQPGFAGLINGFPLISPDFPLFSLPLCHLPPLLSCPFSHGLSRF